MRSIDYAYLKSILLGKASAMELTKGRHVTYYVSWKGKRRWVTMISHGARGQIDDSALGKIAREVRLSKKMLLGFVECTVSLEEWMTEWEKRNPYRR